VLLLPANVYAAVADVPFHGAAATSLWLRIPEQVLYIAAALYEAKSGNPVRLRPPSVRLPRAIQLPHALGRLADPARRG
jgi:hypothetical protein